MALRPKIIYPAQINASDPNYPHGKARNRAVAGDGTGTPWEAQIVNELFGFQQALLRNAGITPSDLPEGSGPNQSQYLEAVAFFTKDLNAVFAVQFPEVWRNMISTFNSFGENFITACLNATDHYTPWIVCYDNAGKISRNRSFNQFGAIQGAFPAGALTTITALSGGQDTVLLALEATASSSKTYVSTDAGQSFTAGVALPSLSVSWTVAAFSHQQNLWFAVRNSGAAYSPPHPGMAWTAQGVAGLSGPRRLIVPRIGETANDVICLTTGPTSYFVYNTAMIWSALNLANIADACWSEYHKRWFAILATGELYSFQSPLSTGPTTWTLERAFWQSGSSVYKRIFALGRYLVILGDYVADASNRVTGSVLVTDRTRHGAFSVDGGGHTHALEFDGRLVLMRGSAGQPLDVAGGMRAPWLLT